MTQTVKGMQMRLKMIMRGMSYKPSGMMGKKAMMTSNNNGARESAMVPAMSTARSLLLEKIKPANHIVKNKARKSRACMANEADKLNVAPACMSNAPSKATRLSFPRMAVSVIAERPRAKDFQPAMRVKGLRRYWVFMMRGGGLERLKRLRSLKNLRSLRGEGIFWGKLVDFGMEPIYQVVEDGG